jgi:hypothetical protein
VQAHGRNDDALRQDGRERSMILFTTDGSKASEWGDTHMTAIVPADSVHPQTLPTSNESEVLVPHVVRTR